MALPSPPMGQPSEGHLPGYSDPAWLGLRGSDGASLGSSTGLGATAAPACQAAFRNHSGLQLGWVVAGL